MNVGTPLRAGVLAAVPTIALAMLTALAVPHARGIGFAPVLRLAVLAPAIALLAVGAAFAYDRLGARRRLAILLAVVGVCGALVARSAAVAVVLVVVVGALALLVPRFAERAPRWRIGLAVLALLEIAGLVAAVSAEKTVEVSHLAFDVEHRFVDLPGGAHVHYIDEGTGPTLLFLHGNPAWSAQWRDLIRGLRGSFRCVALDYPGFGMSDAPSKFGFTPREQSDVVERFVTKLQLHDVTLVMQDWGGPIGLGFAERRPELVARVVLGGTWISPTTTDMPRGKFSLIAGGPIGELAQVNFNALARFAVTSSIAHPVSDEVRDLYILPFRAPERRGIAAFYPGQITAATDYFQELVANLPRLATKPALVFWAHQDPGAIPLDRQLFESTFTRHRTVELPNASHFFFEDEPDRVIEEIRAFVPAGP